MERAVDVLIESKCDHEGAKRGKQAWCNKCNIDWAGRYPKMRKSCGRVLIVSFVVEERICPDNHEASMSYRKNHCSGCDLGIVVAAISSIQSAENRKEAVARNVKACIAGGHFCDMDGMWSDAVSKNQKSARQFERADGSLTSRKVVTPIASLDEYRQTHAFFMYAYMDLFMQVFPASPLSRNRLAWPLDLSELAKNHTIESVLDFDREIRSKYAGDFWDARDILAQSILVKKGGNIPISSPDGKKKKKRKKAAGKKAVCHAAQRGENCKFGDDCHFSHVHPKCGKDNKHVWADCV